MHRARRASHFHTGEIRRLASGERHCRRLFQTSWPTFTRWPTWPTSPQAAQHDARQNVAAITPVAEQHGRHWLAHLAHLSTHDVQYCGLCPPQMLMGLRFIDELTNGKRPPPGSPCAVRFALVGTAHPTTCGFNRLAKLAHLSTHDVQYPCRSSADRRRANATTSGCLNFVANLAMLAHFSRRRRKALQENMLAQ
jgi:hypothetical protein